MDSVALGLSGFPQNFVPPLRQARLRSDDNAPTWKRRNNWPSSSTVKDRPKTGTLSVSKKYCVVTVVLWQSHPTWRHNCQHFRRSYRDGGRHDVFRNYASSRISILKCWCSMLSSPYDSRETVASGLLINLLPQNFALVSQWEFMWSVK